MSTSPDYNVIVRRTIERYRTLVQEAPRVEHRAPAGLVPIIAKLVAENERDGVLFRGEARCHNSVSSSLFRKLKLSPDGGNFDRLLAHDEETIGRTDDTHGTTRIAKLSRAQHYNGDEGSRTNLIDFTESIPVALYFACKGCHRQDGRIIISDMTAFVRNEDLDVSCRRTQSIRPPFYDDNRNIHQWSHFVYPANGILEDAYLTVCIPFQYKAPILEHLKVNCGIREESIFTSGQSWFETQGFVRRSLNTHLLGVTMEWLGNRQEAQRIYSALGIHAAPDSTIRCLEWEGESQAYSIHDAWALSRMLVGKASTLCNLADSQWGNGCTLDETERLWMMALATAQLSADVSPLCADPGIPEISSIFYRLGRCTLEQGKKDNDQVILGQAIAILKLAIHQRGLEDCSRQDFRMADMSYALADAEFRAGNPYRSARRLKNTIDVHSTHPGSNQFKELLAKIEGC